MTVITQTTPEKFDLHKMKVIINFVLAKNGGYKLSKSTDRLTVMVKHAGKQEMRQNSCSLQINFQF